MSSAQLNDATRVFEEVIKDFRASLSPTEKGLFKEFGTSRDMIQDLQTRCKDVRNGRKLSKLCQRIDRFASAWEPFFEITTIFVQTHPEFAGFAWGAIRLVFLLGTNYIAHLEKLVSMLQRIGETLPAYEEYFNLFMNRRKSDNNAGPNFTLEVRHHRLCKALSYVYADLVQFCQEACKIFGTKRGGAHYTPSLIADVFWRPFDSRFASLLDRMQSHREVFRSEMQLEESKYLEQQNEKRAQESNMNSLALQQIRQQIEDLRDSNEQLDSRIFEQLEIFEHSIEQLRRDAPTEKEVEAKNLETLNAKIPEIKAWIDAPDYMREYEKARRTRLPDTGEYLLNNSIYQDWKLKESAQNLVGSNIAVPELPKVLFLKGKPGFGKTILSSLIIEDLRDSYTGVLFYHFASERQDDCGAYHALRAVLVQLLHRFRACKDAIDRLAVLMNSDGSGQATASDEEVVASLSLLLETIPDIVLIFDGVDECQDHAEFLDILREICSATFARVLLLTRPNVEIPTRFPHLAVSLDSSSNLSDIRLYLRPQMTLLQERRLLLATVQVNEIVDILASRAEGMFLWAWLMTQYLNCRALTPKDRLDAIFTPSLVEGLDDVYGKIIGVLDRGYQKEKDHIRRIFEFIAVATRPFDVSELQIAVAIIPGRVTEPSNVIVDYESALPVICGALVEVQSNRTVRFVHSSLRDFLTQKGGSRNTRPFSVDERLAHANLSTVCLSYILHDLPSSSICHAIGSKEVAEAKASFPFLAYALEWTRHAAHAFRSSENGYDHLPDAQDEFDRMLLRFLNRPLSVTAWIEASWICRSGPSLAVIHRDVNQITPSEASSLFTTRHLALTLIGELSAELERLNTAWSPLLEDDPSAIWGSSVTAFSHSPFWYQSKETVVSLMLPTEAIGSYQKGSEHRPILVKSQVSTTGDELGIVMILPSRSYLLAAETLFRDLSRGPQKFTISDPEKRRLAEVCSSGWYVRFQRRDTGNEAILMDLIMELPERQISDMLQQCLTSKTPHRFPFPVALSRDLNRLIVLRSILTIRSTNVEGSDKTVAECKIQSLDPEVGAQWSNNSNSQTAFYSLFSPDESALAFVFGRLNPGTIDCKRIQVWSNTAADGDWPCFECNGEVTSSRLSWKTEASREPFAFHPYLPLLAYSKWNSTAIWRYRDGQSSGKIVLNRSVTSLSFTDDGTHLQYGSLHCDGYGAAVSTKEAHDEEKHKITLATETIRLSQDILQELELLPEAALAKQRAISASITNAGAVVSGSSLLVHLPRLKQGDQTEISLLPTAENDEWVRLIWNKDAQESYSIYDHQSPHLPSIIYRKHGTIQKIEGNDRDSKRRRLQ